MTGSHTRHHNRVLKAASHSGDQVPRLHGQAVLRAVHIQVQRGKLQVAVRLLQVHTHQGSTRSRSRRYTSGCSGANLRWRCASCRCTHSKAVHTQGVGGTHPGAAGNTSDGRALSAGTSPQQAGVDEAHAAEMSASQGSWMLRERGASNGASAVAMPLPSEGLPHFLST